MKYFLIVALLSTSAFGQGTIEIRKNGKVVATDRDDRTTAVRVLFVGNSLTFWNELPWMTRRVAGSLGAKPPLVTEFNGRSGASLRQHWDRGEALRIIRQRRWDFVVLQPQSTEMTDSPEETTRYARYFDQEIDKTGAKTVIFATWVPNDRSMSQAALTDRYVALARQLDARVAPVGTAVGHLSRTGMKMLDPGGVHPSLKGSYLAACIFYSTFYGESPEGAAYTFETKFDIPESYRRDLEQDKLDPESAAKIQSAAWKAVEALEPAKVSAAR
ncbi:MAG: SGNH/GDSL hydrolase family protein [Thermoanaerobaculia bacterium]